MNAVLSPDTDRAAWLEARRKGIGASEIAAAMGISPWESPFSLYWRKVNGWDYEPSAEMEWGNRLEQAIADKYVDSHPDRALARGQLERHPVYDWMLATPDRYVWAPPVKGVGPNGLVELKTAHNADGWGEPGTAEVPVHYKAQAQWQMAVCDIEWVDFAVLIGGSDYREYTVPWDQRDIDTMFEHGRRFMARLEAGDPPPLDDHHATLTTLKRLHPDLDDVDAEVPDPIARAYLRAVAMERRAANLRNKYEALMRAQMGSARRATVDGRKVATRVITEVAESTVTRAAHRRDYLLPPREKK